MIYGTAALAITAGGACGYECKARKSDRDRDRAIETFKLILSLAIEGCGEDQACIDTAKQNYQQNLQKLAQWYLDRIDSDHTDSKEDRDRLKKIIEDAGGKFVDKLLDMAGSVSGNASIVEITAIPVVRNQIAADSGPTDGNVDGEGVGSSSSTASELVTGVANTINSSVSPIDIPVQTLRSLEGSFIMNIVDSPTFEPGEYAFKFSFVIGQTRIFDGLNVRRISSGSASIQSTNLVFVLDSNAGLSELVIGPNGRGILRLSGLIVSSDPNATIPVYPLLKFDLPVEVLSDGSLSIQTAPFVDFNVLANIEEPWYIDFDKNGILDSNDRVAFADALASLRPSLDLNADEVFDGLDMMVFDNETASFTARRAFLSQQGVD